MSNKPVDFMTLLKEGKADEAREWVEEQKVKAKYSPDTIVATNGKPPRFTKKGKPVELDKDGKWQPKQ